MGALHCAHIKDWVLSVSEDCIGAGLPCMPKHVILINAKVCLVFPSNFYRGETSCTENGVESGEIGTRVDYHIPGGVKDWRRLDCYLSCRETRITYLLLSLLKTHAT